MISYETAKQMKELGLTQKRHKNAKYYVTADIIMDFEAIHDLKDAKAWFEKRFEEQVNWQDHFTYIPELIDLIGTESYNLTLEAAVFHFIEGKKSHQEDQQDIIVATESAEKLNLNVTLEKQPKDYKNVIADSTLEGIEKIKQAMKQNATQVTTPTI